MSAKMGAMLKKTDMARRVRGMETANAFDHVDSIFSQLHFSFNLLN